MKPYSFIHLGGKPVGNARILRVGLLQIEITLKNRAMNQEKIRKWLKRYMHHSPHPTALVLPELWDVGYCLDQAAEYGDENAGECAAFLGELAQQYGVWFAGGSVLASEKGRHFNRSLIISPEGRVVDSYDKAHLLPFITSEVGIISGGQRACVYDLGPAKCGNVICYDIRFPEWVRVYALQGIEVLFVCGEWTAHRMDLWKTMLRAHAIENTIYVVATNCAGPSGDILYGGGSIVCAPSGEVLYEAGESEAGGFVDLDLDALKETRDFLRVFESRVPRLYGKITEE